ncbi:aldehyde dehydrogenase [Streptomyces abyssalis]|uniref:Aldehyde dehydrogenase n=1 Tax=Streptomyces abyssalis TaxID=933944 RepID=A0A1E7JQJ4_9ACTN|nr:aldehyde dehydrogenase family protein [Streptomyces abyssalis]OEU90557.1 aldehyde dehydrogenase [Streptomyces abyssalis]OEU95296.1 aldehyde dehydrogenase [Streptomyces abyssalis]OEV04739.1 aldehyde dehydrogenase [Streptomyces nanshensis]
MSYFTDLALQYIDGQWCEGSGSWDIIDFDPYNDDKLAAITVATAEEVDHAYRAAQRHQRDWAKTNPYTRRQVFERAIRIIEDNEQEISEALISEVGGTRLKADIELHQTKEFLREAVHLALRAEGRIVPSPIDGKENRVHRVPVGVVGVVTPFHFPFLLSLKTITPALALGNAVVLKPHQNSPVCGGSLVAWVLEEAGLPPGLLNVVITDTAEIGDTFIAHPVPKVISFTGSEPVGRQVATVAASHFKRTVLEMGGNSALIVLDDADVDYAVDAAVFSRFVHQGQVCMSANRIIVDRDICKTFNEKFTAKVETLKVGDPRDPDTQIGPLINAVQADKVNSLVERTIEDGATALVRGTKQGNLVSPSILTDLPDGSPALREEILGPVALVIPVDGDDEAVRVANDTPYGLGGAVHTGNIDRGLRMAHRIETGMVHINDTTVADEPIVPFGGEKNSGLGRLNGEQMVDAFTTTKWISIQHDRSGFPF